MSGSRARDSCYRDEGDRFRGGGDFSQGGVYDHAQLLRGFDLAGQLAAFRAQGGKDGLVRDAGPLEAFD